MEEKRRLYEDWVEEIYSLTLKRRRRDLALQLGKSTSGSCAASFGPTELLGLKELIKTTNGNNRVYYEAADHYLRTKAEPFQAMLTTWMSGAKAYVRDEVIPFNDAINWCQNAPDATDRKTLAKELLALCRFLTQFSHATWEAIITIVTETLGFESYLEYNEKKRDISIRAEASRAKTFLDGTRENYIDAISLLTGNITQQSVEDSSRFDAIYIMGLRYLDTLFPDQFSLREVHGFLEKAGISLRKTNHLKIHEVTSGHQSYCVPVEIPGEIHIIVGKLTGWLDLESLFHELGHALSFLHTDSKLPIEAKDFFHSAALAESYAFLLQKASMSAPFLENVLNLDRDTAKTIEQIHHVKWLMLARRYAAKLIIETRNFDNVELLEGKEYYARIMMRETGFFYEPDTYLFDLMPDFYTLDYLQGFAGASIMDRFLKETYGENWFLVEQAWNTLRDWWFYGNKLDISEFIDTTIARPFDFDCLIEELGQSNISATDLERIIHN